jgi:hypothetical protein
MVSPELNGDVSAGVTLLAKPASTPERTVVGDENVASVSYSSSYWRASFCGSLVTNHSSGVSESTFALSNGSA